MLKPRVVKNLYQKGKSSQKLRPIGKPIVVFLGPLLYSKYSLKIFLLTSQRFKSVLVVFFVTGRSQRLPLMYLFPKPKSLTAKWQLLLHSPQLAVRTVCVKEANSEALISLLESTREMAYKAAPQAPIIPEISGRTTSKFNSFSKALKTASLQKVPP